MSKKRMRSRIFHAYAHSTMLSIYYTDIAHTTVVLYTHTYIAGNAVLFMWSSLRLVPITKMKFSKPEMRIIETCIQDSHTQQDAQQINEGAQREIYTNSY